MHGLRPRRPGHRQRVRAPRAVLPPPGWVEHDPIEIWSDTKSTIAATVEDADWAGQALWDGAAVAGGYVLEDFVELDLPARVVHALFDYSAGYSPGDLMRVADDRVGSSLAAIRVAVERFAEQRG